MSLMLKTCIYYMKGWDLFLLLLLSFVCIVLDPCSEMLSSEVISRTTLGSNIEEGNIIFELQRELAVLVIDAIQSFYIPGSRFLPTKTNNRIKKIDREVRATIRSIIDKRTIAMKAVERSKDDLLGILLESNYREIKHGYKNSGLTIDEVIDECKLFYFAGQETIGILLVCTMFLLAQHTNWQERAREEVSQVFGHEKTESNGLNRLKIVSLSIPL
ncbi:cytochrome P450 CYP72A219-like [Lactuca sativa]|uniref:Cytochrome P450 n=1 Tax=Lactuca sativa TaxID=4236 RepID=A0A9R1UPU3_LACSA|nr:cytochrome P450 CYP72A219-like [Lactuca sativa]KAJ0191677.1 hypothetical protein LSAT_V11C800401630 [Lactuca sativa]